MEKLHEAKEMDTVFASRGVWLVKVPKYLADRWAMGTETGEIGKLTFISRPDARPEVSLRIPERLAAQETASDSSGVSCPTRYRLSAVPGSRQQLLIYSQESVGPSFSEDGAVPDLSDFRLKIEGHVNHRAECKPDTSDKKYLQHKLEHLRRSNQPTRQVQHTNLVQTYRPKASHESREEEIRHKEQMKRTRDDPEIVRERVYKAFEKHQYYNIRDLVNLTQQPVTYLKEILKDICNYNMRAPHRNMWELKPEYRHYSNAS